MSVFELAKKYYPRLWSAERIRALAEAGKLTAEEAEGLLGKEAAGVTQTYTSPEVSGGL